MSVSLLDSLMKKTSSGDFSSDSSSDLRASVIDNIKYLLESRQPLIDVSDDYPGAIRSLLRYGLSAHHLGRSHYQGNRLCREIEELVSHFEPRLKEVVVEMIHLNEQGNCISFRIEGVLTDRHIRTPVGFDSVLNLTDTRLDIEEAGVV